MTETKLRQVAWVWGLSLIFAALLAAAGARWPGSLPPRADWALALVLLPPLAMALWLLGRRPGPADGRGGESPGTQESAAAEQETH